MTMTSGCAEVIWRVASIPLISGMLISISTRAGCSLSTSSIASRPLAASPTSSKASLRRRTAFAAERNGICSSTTRTGCERGPPSASHARPAAPRVLPSGGGCGHLPGAATASAIPSLAEEEEHRLDPAVDIFLFRQAQLHEDRVGVLLHGALGDEHGSSDRRIALALSHLGN